MVIGEFSKITGISAYTLRYYEKKGLIRVNRDCGGRRNYSEEDIEWVKFIQRLKDTGMLLRDIKRYSDLRYEGDKTIKERMDMLLAHRKFVLEEQKRWREYLDNLDEKIEIYRKRIRAAKKEDAEAGAVKIRALTPKEYPLLEDFLYDAIYLPEGAAPLPREIIRQPELAVYVEDFGRPNDCCLVAESKGRILGAVWTRILAGGIRGYGNIDEHTPEVAISVKKEFRRRGIGRSLMEAMISRMREQGHTRVSLSVNKENYAFEMYRKLGFQVIKEQDEDYLMKLELGESVYEV